MKNLIIALIIIATWLFISCASDATITEPDTPPPPIDTTIIPVQDSVLLEVYCMYIGTRTHHYIAGQPTNPSYTNIVVDSLKLIFNHDSLFFKYQYNKYGRWIPVEGRGSMYTVLRKLVWKE